MADLPFVDFEFNATGAPTNRTMPDRLSETVVNVMDFGAKGDSSVDDQPAIQAAIDYCISATDGHGNPKQPGGKVYFPRGLYNCAYEGAGLNIGSNSDPNVRVIIEGGPGAQVSSNFMGVNQFFWSKGSRTYPSLIGIEGLVTFGGIKLELDGAYVKKCTISATCLIDASGVVGALIESCDGGNFPNVDNAGDGVFTYDPSTVCVYLGEGGLALDCRFQGTGFVCYAVCGDGTAITGGSLEVGNIGIRVGWGPSGETTDPVSGCLLQGLGMERYNSFIELYHCRAVSIQGVGQTAAPGVPGAQMGGTLTWNAGTGLVTADMHAPHNLPDGVSKLQFWGNGSLTYSGLWFGSGTYDFWNCTKTGANTFTFGNPDGSPIPDPTAETAPSLWWTYPLRYILRCRKVSESFIQYQASGHVMKACIDLDFEGDTEVAHKNNVFCNASGVDAGWIMPSISRNLAGWTFIQCATPAPTKNVDGTSGPNGHMVFADLPGQYDNSSGRYQDGPFEGQEYSIKDASTVSIGSTVSGSSNQHYKVRYNGTDWIRIG